MRIKRKFLALLIFFLSVNIYAGRLKKLIVLDIINIDNEINYRYLEPSLTEAIRDSLKKKFAFKETPAYKWKERAKANYIYKKDYYTGTAAMNLGLLSGQDIVIAGGFRVKNIKSNINRELTTIIRINILILDIAKRKIIAEIKMDAKADSTILTSIDKIVGRIINEAKKILPDKSKWKKTDLSTEAEPLFENPLFGIRSGISTYSSGYADRIDADIPTFALVLRGNIPFIWHRLSLGGEFAFLQHSWKNNFNEITKNMNIETNNYFTGLSLGIDFNIFKIFKLYPHLGGGYVFQSTTISGELNRNTNNSFPYAELGLDLAYRINRYIYAVFAMNSKSEIESGTLTFLHSAYLGINLKL